MRCMVRGRESLIVEVLMSLDMGKGLIILGANLQDRAFGGRFLVESQTRFPMQ